MSDPQRLLDEGATPFEAELLGAWKAERPPEGARAKLLAMAGVASVAVGASAAQAGAPGAGAAKAAGSLLPAPVSGMLAVKSLVVGALAVAGLGTAVQLARRPSPPLRSPTPTVASVASVAVVEAPLAPSIPLAEARPSSAEASEPPTSAPRAVGPHAVRSAPIAKRPSTEDLTDEVRVIDRARRALADGDAASALREVADHDARFAHGALAQEADALRIEALVAKGDRATARRLADRFLAAHPASPHARRIRLLLGDAPEP